MIPIAKSSESVSHSINKCIYITINSHSFVLHPIFMFGKSVQTVKDEWTVIKKNVRLNVRTYSISALLYLHTNLGRHYSWNDFPGMNLTSIWGGKKIDWKVDLLYLDISMKQKNSWYRTRHFRRNFMYAYDSSPACLSKFICFPALY